MAADQPSSSSPTQAGSKPPDVTPSAEGVFSLEDLDKIIEAEDPNFKNEMEGLRKSSVGAGAELESLGIKTDDESLTKEEDPEKRSKIRKILDKLLKPIHNILAKIKLFSLAFKNRFVLFFDKTITFFRHELPERIKFTISELKKVVGWAKGQVQVFMGLNRLQKSAFIALCVLSLASLYFLSRAIGGRYLPVFIRPIPLTLAGHPTDIKSFQNIEELQDFFQAFPEVEYHILIPKIIVNLKKPQDSQLRPMGAFELYLGVDSQDTAVEVKDREKEMVDLVQRTFENFTYEETLTVVGKVKMKNAVRERVNAALNQGYVFNVYFNLFVTHQ